MGRADDRGSDGKEFDRARPDKTQLTHHCRYQGRMDLQPTAPVIRRTGVAGRDWPRNYRNLRIPRISLESRQDLIRDIFFSGENSPSTPQGRRQSDSQTKEARGKEYNSPSLPRGSPGLFSHSSVTHAAVHLVGDLLPSDNRIFHAFPTYLIKNVRRAVFTFWSSVCSPLLS